MRVDIDALDAAIGEEDWEAIHSAALRIAQNELDLGCCTRPSSTSIWPG